MTTYAERPWLKHYDPEVPHSLEPYPNKALHHMLEEQAATAPDREITITSLRLPLFGRKDSRMTLGQLNRASDALAMAFVRKGLKKGDRVAIVLPNSAAFAITYYAILKAGGVVAACNPTYPPPKMAYQINDCDAEFIIVLSPYYNMIKSIQPETKLKHIIVTNIKEYFPPLGKMLFTLAVEKKEGHFVEKLADGDFWFQDLLSVYDGQKPEVEVSGSDLALFQYTGGTTGVSKGAMSTHKALVANMLQSIAWIKSIEPDYENTIALGALPMFHVYGMVLLLSYSVTVGQKIALVVNARDIDDLVDIIDTYKPNSFSGVPALFNSLNNHPRVMSGEVSLECFELATSGSAPLPPTVQTKFEEKISGPMTQGFGMSEAPTATHSNPVSGMKKLNSIGVPWPDVDCRIVSMDDGETDLPVGDVGELVMSCPNLMKGYHKMPTETNNVLREKDGKMWLYTGDIARMDEDGYFFIVDRKKDMALIGGFNVYPATIEKVLKSHPAVLEVGVAGVPHPEREGEEAVKAWVVLKEGMQVTEEELIEHCSQQLAPYEVPRRYRFVDELPKSAVGKTLRRELVKWELEERDQK